MLIAPPTLTIAARLKGTGESPPLGDLQGSVSGINDEESLSAGAFGALLNATRAGLALPEAAGTSTSSAQMFEPPVTDAHEHRLSALKDQYSADLRSQADNRRLDTTSVGARQALDARGRTGSPTPHLSTTTPDPGPSATAGKTPAVVQESDGGRGLHSKVAGELSAGTARVGGQGSSLSYGQGDGAHGPGRQAPPLTADVQLAPGSVPPAAAPGVVPSATPAAAQPESVSQQVGRVLGAATSGEADSARAVASSSASDGPHQSGSRSPHTKRFAQGRPAQTSRSGQQTDETASSKRSEFDRLVRSIHLRAGARNSTARLHLEPPELGRIRIDVRMTAARGDSPEQIQIEVRTETAKARELLYDRSVQLKEALEHHGIRVERFDVTRETPSHEGDDQVEGNDSGSDGDRWNGQSAAADREKTAGATAPHETTDSDDPGASETAMIEPDQTAGAEARLDIRI